MTPTDLTTEETWRLGEAVVASENGQGFSMLCRYVETLLADRGKKAVDLEQDWERSGREVINNVEQSDLDLHQRVGMWLHERLSDPA